MRLFLVLFSLLLTATPALSGQTDTRSQCHEGDLLSCSLILARGPSQFSADLALMHVVKGFTEANRLKDALGALGEMRGDFWKPQAEAAVVKLLVRESQHQQALKMATASKGNEPLVALGDFYQESGDLKRAELVVSEMADRMDHAKVFLLSDLALAHHKAGRKEETAALFGKIEKIARAQKERIPGSDLLLRLAELGAKIDKPDRAVKLALEALAAADDKHRTQTMRALHQHFSHKVAVRARVFGLVLGLGRLELALKLAREQADAPGFHGMAVTRTALMRRIAKALSDKGQTKKAQSLIREVKPASTCGPRGPLSVVAVGYDEAGDETRALNLLEGMKADERMWAMCDLAEGRLKRGKPEAARLMADRIEKAVFRAGCFLNLSEKSVNTKQKDWSVRFITRAIAISRRKEMDKYRSYKLIRASKLLFWMGRTKQALALIDEAKAAIKLEEENNQKRLWEDILGALIDAGYCDLALEVTDKHALSESRISMASSTCARQQQFGAAVRLVLRLEKAQKRAAALARVGGLAAKEGWKPDPATLELMGKKILDVKP